LLKLFRKNIKKLKCKKTNKKNEKTELAIENKNPYQKNIRQYIKKSEYWSWFRMNNWFNEFNDDKLEDFEIAQKLKFLGVK